MIEQAAEKFFEQVVKMVVKKTIDATVDLSRKHVDIYIFNAMIACELLMEVFPDFDTRSKLQSMYNWLSDLSLDGKNHIEFGSIMCMKKEVGLSKIKDKTFWKTIKLLENGSDVHAGMEQIRLENNSRSRTDMMPSDPSNHDYDLDIDF